MPDLIQPIDSACRELNQQIADLVAHGCSPERIARELPSAVGDDQLVALVLAHHRGLFRVQAVSA